MKNIFTIFLLLVCGVCFGQNLIANSDFESNGQPLCSGWYDDCGNELTFLCAGVVDSGCNSTSFGAQMYQDAPPGGGQWCMKVEGYGQSFAGKAVTVIYGQFLGVYEVKVWMKPAAWGARGSLLLYPQLGNSPKGMGGVELDTLGWDQVTYRDTIHWLSDNIIIKLTAIASTWPASETVYFDLPEFRMIESWITDVKEQKKNAAASLFPNPFSTQLTFTLTDNEQLTVSLYNFLGQQVLRQTVTNSATVNTEQMQDGIYFYELRSNKGTLKTGKLVKQ